MGHIKSQTIIHKLPKCPKSTVFLNYTGGPFPHSSLTLLNHSGEKLIGSFQNSELLSLTVQTAAEAQRHVPRIKPQPRLCVQLSYRP